MSRTFVVEVDSPLGREDVRSLVLTKLSIPLGKAQYRIESENETMVAYARTYRPYWTIAALFCWLLLPLILLLVEQTDRVILTLVEGTEGTRIIVVGDGPAALARHFEQLNDLEPQAP